MATETSGGSWHFGNAHDEADEHRGWFVGHFMDDGDIRHSEDVEVKWGIHPVGDVRHSWQDGETRTAVSILVKGRFRIDFADASQVLARPGDYVIWGPGQGHSWTAEEESIVVTCRWPSSSQGRRSPGPIER